MINDAGNCSLYVELTSSQYFYNFHHGRRGSNKNNKLLNFQTLNFSSGAV